VISLFFIFQTASSSIISLEENNKANHDIDPDEKTSAHDQTLEIIPNDEEHEGASFLQNRLSKRLSNGVENHGENNHSNGTNNQWTPAEGAVNSTKV